MPNDPDRSPGRGTAISIVVLVCVSVLGCSIGNQLPTDHPFPTTRANIEQHLRDTGAPSISVAVARDGRIIWQESFGLADVEKRIEATPHTMYHLGSLGKVYTATAIMILVERGLVDLDTPVNEYLEDAKLHSYEGNVEDVTIRRVLNHTSGLPFFWVHLYEDELDLRPGWDEVISHFATIVSPPGDRHIYSNLGFGILGHIIERVSGRPYHEFMRTEVFEPLGLHRTAIDSGPYDVPHMAQKYTPEGKVPYSDHICKGGGTVFASAHDLVRFGMFHMHGHGEDQRTILSDASISAMQNDPASISPVSSYVIGWQAFSKYGYRIVQHGGHVIGALSLLTLIPSEHIAVAVVSNGEGADVPLVHDWILAELLPRYRSFFTMRQRSASGSPGHPDTFHPPSDLAGIWRGEIFTTGQDLPVEMRIEENGEVSMRYLDDTLPPERASGSQPAMSVQFINGILTARFPLQIPTPFTDRYDHTVGLNVKLHDEVLSGYISAEAWSTTTPHFCVPFYIRLVKEEVKEVDNLRSRCHRPHSLTDEVILQPLLACVGGVCISLKTGQEDKNQDNGWSGVHECSISVFRESSTGTFYRKTAGCYNSG